MNCHEFDKLIVRLACETLTSDSLRKQALAHAAACTQCSARLARQQNVANRLDVLAMQERSIQAPAHLGAALQAAFERRMNVAPEPTGLRLPGWLNWRWAAVAAAVILCAVATVALWRRSSDSPQPTQVMVSVPRTENKTERKETASPPQVEPKTIAQAAPVKRRVPQNLPQRLKAARRNVEDYGELLSLTPLAQTEPEEFQQVVRMQIPRATLRLWGLPLNEESNSEQVSAEVHFSEDGVARAIRLRN